MMPGIMKGGKNFKVMLVKKNISGNSNYLTQSSSSSLKLISNEESSVSHSIISTSMNKVTIYVDMPRPQTNIVNTGR